MKVEILKRIYGVATEDIRSAAMLIEYRGRNIRVMDPITLFQAKLENALKLPQQNRQDVKHARMMVLCVRAFLREPIAEVEGGRLAARNCLDALERVLQIASGRTARTATTRHGIQWPDTMPMKELRESSSAKLRNFAEKRLPRWMESLTSKK